jgi:uncharacterized tellurite resistance protein B-like protein
MDDKLNFKEQGKLFLHIIQQTLSLMVALTNSSTMLGKQRKNQSSNFFQFTPMINKLYSQEQKLHLIELLWKITLIDGAPYTQ